MANEWMAPTPVRRVEARPDAVIESDWPTSLAPVRQLLDEGLDLPRAIVLVGENGTGKSTLVEAIAMAFGMNGEGGSTGAIHTTWTSESPLHDWLQLVRGVLVPHGGATSCAPRQCMACYLLGRHTQ